MSEFNIGIKHKIFNNEVRKRRIEKGLTQKELSIMCGMSEQSIGRIESFDKYPTREEGEKIAENLDSYVEILFPTWVEIFKQKKSSFVTEHLVTEKLLENYKTPALLVDGMNEFEDKLNKNFIKENIDKAMETLSSRERKVIELRFGFKDGVARTCDEVGEMFGVTRERIRQIEMKACRKMRHPSTKLCKLIT